MLMSADSKNCRYYSHPISARQRKPSQSAREGYLSVFAAFFPLKVEAALLTQHVFAVHLPGSQHVAYSTPGHCLSRMSVEPRTKPKTLNEGKIYNFAQIKAKTPSQAIYPWLRLRTITNRRGLALTADARLVFIGTENADNHGAVRVTHTSVFAVYFVLHHQSAYSSPWRCRECV